MAAIRIAASCLYRASAHTIGTQRTDRMDFPDRRRLHAVWTGTILGAGYMVAVEMQRAGDRYFDGLLWLVERFCQAMVKKQADKLLPRAQESGVVRTPGINRRSRIGLRCGLYNRQCGDL